MCKFFLVINNNNEKVNVLVISNYGHDFAKHNIKPQLTFFSYMLRKAGNEERVIISTTSSVPWSARLSQAERSGSNSIRGMSLQVSNTCANLVTFLSNLTASLPSWQDIYN